MEPTLIVVDDFYPDPVAVRQWALRQEYVDASSTNYSGCQSRSPFSSDWIWSRFSTLIGRQCHRLGDDVAFGVFRYSTSSTSGRRIHIDGANEWTALVSMSEPLGSDCGTTLFRHRGTGILDFSRPDRLAQLTFACVKDAEEAIIIPDSMYRSRWKTEAFVPHRFNRLLLFRGGSVPHAGSPGYGTSVADARLTQNFFFSTSHAGASY